MREWRTEVVRNEKVIKRGSEEGREGEVKAKE
jgi:hypothetical protein